MSSLPPPPPLLLLLPGGVYVLGEEEEEDLKASKVGKLYGHFFGPLLCV